MTTLVWFREDLRLHDNPALSYAAAKGAVLPVFVLPQGLGGARRWWLHHSLESLARDLAEQDVSLILRTGQPQQILTDICIESNITEVVYNRVYSPDGIQQGTVVKETLRDKDIGVKSFNGQLLIEPTEILNKQGQPFKVFTPFWRHCLNCIDPAAVQATADLQPAQHKPDSEPLSSWELVPTHPDWSTGLGERWQPGETGAAERWQGFLEDTINNYKSDRDFPELEQTSMLSPHLANGEISPRQVWLDTQHAMSSGEVDMGNGQKFLAEIGWREFSRYLLVHFPHIVDQPFNSKFRDFPWQNDDKLLKSWQKGETGYPLVDAGMRELWHTGYMHNRVRMIVASFLTKHCLIHWQHGMDWFWDTLVDADVANNTASWQWVAGSGADASPYFRIFNPTLQSEKFDGQGVYIKRWVPELEQLPAKHIHQPWLADEETLSQAEVLLGENYPLPIVDHKEAREQALQAYQAIKNQ